MGQDLELEKKMYKYCYEMYSATYKARDMLGENGENIEEKREAYIYKLVKIIQKIIDLEYKSKKIGKDAKEKLTNANDIIKQIWFEEEEEVNKERQLVMSYIDKLKDIIDDADRRESVFKNLNQIGNISSKIMVTMKKEYGTIEKIEDAIDNLEKLAIELRKEE